MTTAASPQLPAFLTCGPDESSEDEDPLDVEEEEEEEEDLEEAAAQYEREQYSPEYAKPRHMIHPELVITMEPDSDRAETLETSEGSRAVTLLTWGKGGWGGGSDASWSERLGITRSPKEEGSDVNWTSATEESQPLRGVYGCVRLNYKTAALIITSVSTRETSHSCDVIVAMPF
ncbi:hypothetical protein ACRRTK_004273 [Alexandromys fortis]